MSDKPRRRWLQIHLSTAIVLMFVAGGLMWMNIGSLQSVTINYEIRNGNIQNPIPIQKDLRYLGWPVTFYGGSPETHRYSFIPAGEITYTPTSLHAGPLAFDILFAFGVLFGSAAIGEWRIRRREARC